MRKEDHLSLQDWIKASALGNKDAKHHNSVWTIRKWSEYGKRKLGVLLFHNVSCDLWIDSYWCKKQAVLLLNDISGVFTPLGGFLSPSWAASVSHWGVASPAVCKTRVSGAKIAASASISQQRRDTRGACAQPNPEVARCWRLRPTVWKEIKMQLHFSSDAVPDSVSGDFHNLNKFTEQVKSPQTSRSSAARCRTQDGFRPASGPHNLQLKCWWKWKQGCSFPPPRLFNLSVDASADSRGACQSCDVVLSDQNMTIFTLVQNMINTVDTSLINSWNCVSITIQTIIWASSSGLLSNY